MTAIPCGAAHLTQLRAALERFGPTAERADRCGHRLAMLLSDGGRLLACGNGGSAAQAQHLTAELVGRYRDDRPAYSAIPLHADTSAVTAIGNDYHPDEVFARQVRAHGRRGDVLVALSTSGHSRNVLRAAEVANQEGLHTWAITGPAPNPLVARCDEALCVDSPATSTVQELHLVAVHLICAAFDVALGVSTPTVGVAMLSEVAS